MSFCVLIFPVYENTSCFDLFRGEPTKFLIIGKFLMKGKRTLGYWSYNLLLDAVATTLNQDLGVIFSFTKTNQSKQ